MTFEHLTKSSLADLGKCDNYKVQQLAFIPSLWIFVPTCIDYGEHGSLEISNDHQHHPKKAAIHNVVGNPKNNGYERYMPALLYLGTLTYVSIYIISYQSDVPVLGLLFVVVWFGCGSAVGEATRLVVWEEGLTPTRVGSGVVRCCDGDVGDGAVNDMALWMESK